MASLNKYNSGQTTSGRGMSCIWITGLSGCGKSTLAAKVVDTLGATGFGQPVLLDGDQLRDALAPLGLRDAFSRDARLSLAKFYSGLCANLAKQGHIVVVSTVSLFHEVQEWNREWIPGYFEVLLTNPLDQLVAVDTRGIYASHAVTQSPRVGVELPAEFPRSPDLHLENSRSESPEVLARLVVDAYNAQQAS